MYRVLIVDDEKWSIFGLKRIVDWNALGFEICWETDDSLKALEIIEENEPDLVVSDIVMPELTGLEMLNCAREKEVESAFIFVSGFADFYYAQQAMEYGAFYYLLKPVKKEDMAACLERLRRQLEQKHPGGADLYEQFSAVTLHGEDLARLGLPAEYPLLQTVLFEAGEKRAAVAEEVARLPQAHSVQFSMGRDRQLYLFNCAEGLEDRLAEVFTDRETPLGISRPAPVKSAGKLEKLYKESRLALLDRFVNGGAHLFRFRPRNYAAVKPVMNQAIDCILGGSPEEASALFRSLPETFLEKRLGIAEVAFLYNELSVCLHGKYSDRESVQEMEFMDCQQLAAKFGSFARLCGYWAELAGEIAVQEQPAAENKSFAQLLEFVGQHYTEQMYLDDVAKKFFLSSVYVCKLFKQVTGSTFSKYITNLRLEKACELLAHTDDTVPEISDKVGYNDYFYFSRLFKKHMSVTPAAYRKMNA